MKKTNLIAYTILLLFCVSPVACINFTSSKIKPASNELTIGSSADAYYHYSLGVNYALERNLDKAISEYKKTLSIEHNSPYLMAELATLYIRKGKVTTAVELLEKSLIYNPGYADTHLILGSLYLNLKEHNNAIKEFEKVIALAPKKLEPYLYLSVLYRERKNYEKAIEVLENLLKIEPESLMGHYYLAKIYAEIKLYAKAEKLLKETLEITPSFKSALVDLAVLYKIQKKNIEAIEIYKKCIKSNPSDIRTRFQLGKTCLELGHYDEAAREFKEILKLDKSNSEAQFSLGLVYFFEGKDYDSAIKRFLLILKKYPSNYKARYFLASAYEKKSLYKSAFEEFRMIPPQSNLYGTARIHMGIILTKDKHTTKAIDLIKKAINNVNRKDELYSFLASLYEETNNLKTAEETLTEGLLFSPQSTNLHYKLGVLYEKTNRTNKGIKEMEEVLKIDPDNAEALNFIGYSYADKEIRLDEAEKMIRRAFNLKPDNGYIADSLGWLYFKQGKMSLAIKYLEKAANILPDDPTIAEHLGDAYTRAGLFKKALKTYRHALKFNHTNNILKKKLKQTIEKLKR